MLEVRGEALIAVEEWLPDDPYPLALVREPEPAPVPDGGSPGPLLERRRRSGSAGPGRCSPSTGGGAGPRRPSWPSTAEGTPSCAAWQLCAAAPVNAYDAQRLLAADGAAGAAAASWSS